MINLTYIHVHGHFITEFSMFLQTDGPNFGEMMVLCKNFSCHIDLLDTVYMSFSQAP